MFYELLKRCVSLCFNVLNVILDGKLPPFGSTCVIVEEDGHYLVVELPGKRIVFPGGFMTWKETPQQAAAREGYEETGFVLQIEDAIGFYCSRSHSWLAMSSICFAFRGKVVDGALRSSIEGRPRWMTEEELQECLSGFARVVFEDYRRQRCPLLERSATCCRFCCFLTASSAQRASPVMAATPSLPLSHLTPEEPPQAAWKANEKIYYKEKRCFLRS